MRSYPVKENHIGSSVSKILRYRQTNILFLYYYELGLDQKLKLKALLRKTLIISHDENLKHLEQIIGIKYEFVYLASISVIVRLFVSLTCVSVMVIIGILNQIFMFSDKVKHAAGQMTVMPSHALLLDELTGQ